MTATTKRFPDAEEEPTVAQLPSRVRDRRHRAGVSSTSAPRPSLVAQASIGDPFAVDQLGSPRGARWLVQGFLPAQGLTLLCGPVGSGRRLLALDLALSLAVDAPRWLGRSARGGSVLLVSNDDPARLAHRSQAWASMRGATLPPPERLLIVPAGCLGTVDPGAALTRISAGASPALVILEPAAMLAIICLLTSSRSDAPLAGLLAKLGEAAPAMLLLTDEAPHPMTDQAAAAWDLRVTTPRLRRLTVPLLRDGPTPDPVILELTNSRGSVVVSRAATGAPGDPTVLIASYRRALSALEALAPAAPAGVPYQAWRAQADFSPATFSRAVKNLVGRGFVQETTGKRYQLAPPSAVSGGIP